MSIVRQSHATAWKGVIAALLAIVVGIGLSRFAYSPLIPAVVQAQWFTASEAAFLGAANLAGYLIGALVGGHLATWMSSTAALRTFMIAASLAFVACAFPLSFGWFFAWRLLSGISGGALMVLAAPTVLPHVPAHRRGLASGVIFTGVGLGIIASGTLVPALVEFGLAETWLALALLCFVASFTAWFWWPKGTAPASMHGKAIRPAGELWNRGLIPVYASYGLIAVGLVPHMVFLVDFIARDLGQGIIAGGRYWVLFGVGALLGPLVAGRLADKIGFGPSLRTVLLLHIASAGLVAVDHSWLSLVVSSLVVGSAVSGTVPLVLGQTQERVADPEARKMVWGIATATFALGQAAGGYGYSYLFSRMSENFELLFVLGATALFLALVVNMLAARPASHSPSREASEAATSNETLERSSR